MAPKIKQSKDKIAAAAAAGSRGKKKKWGGGHNKDKLNNAVIIDQVTYDKLISEIPKSKFVSPSIVSERLKVSVSVAKKALRLLKEKGLIKSVGEPHSAQMIYTRAITKAEEKDEKAPKEKEDKSSKEK